MHIKYSLNEQTLLFIQEFETSVESGTVYTVQELVGIFEKSSFNKNQFDTYKKPKNSSIWWALTRSGNWLMLKRGTYKKK
ncbi:hypothetical protein HNV23_23230 [Bacillus paranthracis]|uniref:hypothetical protein n=1 Tax=Bacillus cereus group TaxID=86661 RepID=UPI000BF64328|nr:MULTISPECIES: hypothetical protein [Bacillus cereus group]MDA1510785.1 hypothetical protein [Bacillus cereus group sp. TH36-2LC]MDA1893389.1 hypothetical protein [Bacillus cereus group sp. BY11-1LC]MDA1901821.1 hypothetical protein [Bacillus cereus group sp. BcHK20]NOP82400.1 hypothetical protein [Bacillus paranthracis]PFU35552.1 hypothetical protein COK69_07225 [Bacillus cereus]